MFTVIKCPTCTKDVEINLAKAIAEEIIRQNLSWDLVWLTKEHHNDIPKQIRQVKYGSPEAMREMATAKMWIINVRNV